MVNVQRTRARAEGSSGAETAPSTSRRPISLCKLKVPLLCLRSTTLSPMVATVLREVSIVISTFSAYTSSSCKPNVSEQFHFQETLADTQSHSTFVPLIFSAIFYASNGDNYVSYTDALFICVSSATVTGLTTIDLSSLTSWQQFLTFVLMFFGSPVSPVTPSRSF